MTTNTCNKIKRAAHKAIIHTVEPPCPHYQGVLTSEVGCLLCIANPLVSIACVHSGRVSAIQGFGSEGFHCIYMYAYILYVCIV